MKYKFEDIAFNSTEKKKPVESDKSHYIGLEHLDSQCLTVNRYGSDVAPIGEKLIMKKGDVLFGKRRAYQKKVAIAPFDGIFSAHGFVLRPKENVIDKNFFPFFISSDYFLDKAISISVGSLSPTINWSDLKVIEFELPDLEEQKRLANILWKIEDVKNSINKTQKYLQNFFSYLSNNLFSTSSNMLELNKVVNFEKKSSYPASFGQENGLYKFYTSGSNITYCNEYIVDGKSIIVNDGGCALIRYNEGKMAYSDHTICLTEKNDKIKLEYIYYFLKSKEKFININLFKGSGLKNIDKKAFKLLKIPIIEQSEQDKIIEKLKTLDKLKKIMNNQYNYLTYVIKNILMEALNV